MSRRIDVIRVPASVQVPPGNITGSDWLPVSRKASLVARPEDFGAVGNGLEDDTAALNAMVQQLAGSDAVGIIPPGTWTLLDRWAIPSSVTVQAEGPGAVIQAPAGTWPTVRPSLIEIIGAEDVTLRGLIIDGDGAARIEGQGIPSVLLVNDARRVTIEGVTFRNPPTGGPVGNAGGPYIKLLGMDRLDEDQNEDTNAVIGGVEDVTIRGCRFEQGANGYAFAIRMMTNWTEMRAKDTFAHHVRNIHIENNAFLPNAAGEGFFWNAIEAAGGGTHGIWVVGNTFAGTTMSHIDFDKGCYDGFALANRIDSAGLPQRWVGDSTKRASTIHVVGNPDYRTTDCVVANNIIRDTVNMNDTGVFANAIDLSGCQNILVTGNIIDNVNNAANGTGIHLGATTPDVTVAGNHIRNVYRGIATHSQITLRDNVVIDGNLIKAAGEGISLYQPDGGTGGTTRGVRVTNNTVETTAPSLPVIMVMGEYGSAVISGNQTYGGGAGVQTRTPHSVVTDNIAHNTSGYAFRAYLTEQSFRGNRAINCVADFQYAVAGIYPEVSGNTWNKILRGTSVPTTGTWGRGDVIYHNAPVAGGHVGWVCVAAGSPGTWRTFGTIAS